MTTWSLPSAMSIIPSSGSRTMEEQLSELYSRISQASFEAWLQDVCNKNPLIDMLLKLIADGVIGEVRSRLRQCI